MSYIAYLVSCLQWWLHLSPFLISETQEAVTIQFAHLPGPIFLIFFFFCGIGLLDKKTNSGVFLSLVGIYY